MQREVQQGLPFGAAEGMYRERESLLLLAIRVVEADLALTTFVKMIFYATGGGSTPYKKTFDELAERPHGLCCSRRTAIRIVEQAVELGWVISTPTEFASGGWSANEYEINWEGIKTSLDLKRRRRPKGRATKCQVVIPWCQDGIPLCQPVTSIKDSSSLNDLLENPPPPSSPAPAARATSAPATISEQSWREAEEALRGCGMQAARQAVLEARSRGLTPRDVSDVVAEFGTLRGELGAGGADPVGALFFRLREGAWPRRQAAATATAGTVDAERAQRAAAAVERLSGFEEAQQQAAREREQLAELEQRHGAELDAADPEELARLLELNGFDGSIAACRRAPRFGRGSALLRGVLLEAWALREFSRASDWQRGTVR